MPNNINPRLAFLAPITPRYRQAFYSSIPVNWQESPENCVTCLPCARDSATPPTRQPITIQGQIV